MDGTKIVTALVLISLTVGCKAKFTSKNAPHSVQPALSASPTTDPNSQRVPSGPPPNSTFPNGPRVEPGAPIVGNPPSNPRPVDEEPPLQQPTFGSPQVGQPIPQAPIEQPPLVVVQGPPTCPTDGDMSIDRSRVIQKKTIVFKRGRQMVWRKNCDGRIYSKTWENLSGRTRQNIVIRPRGPGPAMTIYNRTTCHATPEQSLIQAAREGSGAFRFAVSTQPSNRAMLVKPGINFIDYEIAGVERGTLILTVRIEDSEGECIVFKDRNCPVRERSFADQFSFGGN